MSDVSKLELKTLAAAEAASPSRHLSEAELAAQKARGAQQVHQQVHAARSHGFSQSEALAAAVKKLQGAPVLVASSVGDGALTSDAAAARLALFQFPLGARVAGDVAPAESSFGAVAALQLEGLTTSQALRGFFAAAPGSGDAILTDGTSERLRPAFHAASEGVQLLSIKALNLKSKSELIASKEWKAFSAPATRAVVQGLGAKLGLTSAHATAAAGLQAKAAVRSSTRSDKGSGTGTGLGEQAAFESADGPEGASTAAAAQQLIQVVVAKLPDLSHMDPDMAVQSLMFEINTDAESELRDMCGEMEVSIKNKRVKRAEIEARKEQQTRANSLVNDEYAKLMAMHPCPIKSMSPEDFAKRCKVAWGEPRVDEATGNVVAGGVTLAEPVWSNEPSSIPADMKLGAGGSDPASGPYYGLDMNDPKDRDIFQMSQEYGIPVSVLKALAANLSAKDFDDGDHNGILADYANALRDTPNPDAAGKAKILADIFGSKAYGGQSVDASALTTQISSGTDIVAASTGTPPLQSETDALAGATTTYGLDATTAYSLYSEFQKAPGDANSFSVWLTKYAGCVAGKGEANLAKAKALDIGALENHAQLDTLIAAATAALNKVLAHSDGPDKAGKFPGQADADALQAALAAVTTFANTHNFGDQTTAATGEVNGLMWTAKLDSQATSSPSSAQALFSVMQALAQIPPLKIAAGASSGKTLTMTAPPPPPNNSPTLPDALLADAEKAYDAIKAPNDPDFATFEAKATKGATSASDAGDKLLAALTPLVSGKGDQANALLGTFRDELKTYEGGQGGEVGGGQTQNAPAGFENCDVLAAMQNGIDKAKDDLDGMGDTTELQQLKLQRLTDAHTKALETLSNLMKQNSTTQDKIIDNLK